MMDEPTDYVKPSERVPKAERRADDGTLIALFVFAVAGIIVGAFGMWLAMTIAGL